MIKRARQQSLPKPAQELASLLGAALRRGLWLRAEFVSVETGERKSMLCKKGLGDPLGAPKADRGLVTVWVRGKGYRSFYLQNILEVRACGQTWRAA